MTDLPAFPIAALLIATFLLAGLVKGVTGLGLPTVGIGLLSLAMPPAQAAALVIVPSFVTNVWQMLAGDALRPLLRRLWPMLAGVAAGTLLAGGLIATAGGLASAGLGLALSVYALVGLSPWPLPRVARRAEPWLGPLAGLVTGAITAATGVFVIPAVPYLQALGLAREALVQALGLSFTVSTVALAVSLAGSGSFGAGVAWHSLLGLLPALLGMQAGQWLRRLVSPAVFRRCFFGGLLLLGAHLLLRAV